MSRLFGEIRQVGYVTREIGKSITAFAATGIGPWFFASGARMKASDAQGVDMNMHLSIALANSGSLQIELIQPIDGDISIYDDTLAASGEEMVVHHYSSWPENLAEVATNARNAGFETILEGRTGYGPFAYFRHPDRPSIIFECAELSLERRSVFGQVAEAALGWDGREPLRMGWPAAG